MHDPSTRPTTPDAPRRRVVITSDAHARGPAGLAPRGAATERPRRHLRLVRERAADYGQDGFTLIELLVVVLMLVALVGIAVPSFVGQRDGAEQAAVQSELRTAAIALESYRAMQGSYSTAALTSQYGFVPSVDVAIFPDISATSFCVVAWFEANGRAGATMPTTIGAALSKPRAWAISPNGMRPVTEASSEVACP
jgi:prepilin-type N-terminal cleavage/methylation domain-containing protein